jgi:hypothetical protein
VPAEQPNPLSSQIAEPPSATRTRSRATPNASII